jgi:hypothetical protein
MALALSNDGVMQSVDGLATQIEERAARIALERDAYDAQLLHFVIIACGVLLLIRIVVAIWQTPCEARELDHASAHEHRNQRSDRHGGIRRSVGQRKN